MSTSERVIEILVDEGGYQLLPKPLTIGTQSFDFTYALVAKERANDLVLIIELKGDTRDEVVIRKVLALTRALDVLGSKRPVTAVLTSGQPTMGTVESIGKVCRILPVGSLGGPNAISTLRDWLAVLLPLTELSAVETTVDWKASMQAADPQQSHSPLTAALIEAALLGKDAVEAVLAEKINAVVNAALEEKGEPK